MAAKTDLRGEINYASTPYADVNAILKELMDGMLGVLGDQLVGLYLDGSLASGDFDRDSDIDFVAVTDEEVSGADFLALQAMHDRISRIDSWWADQLEGSYISRQAVRCDDPQLRLHPNLERGRGERLKMADHDATWIVHRSILREHGIRIYGPALKSLIDPVPPDELRKAMRLNLEWSKRFFDNPDLLTQRGYQSYMVLTMCRILYTLVYGAVVSKPRAASWLMPGLDEKWKALIERAKVGRHTDPGGKAEAEDIRQTLEFIRYTIERSKLEYP